jgi:hypothetical protein
MAKNLLLRMSPAYFDEQGRNLLWRRVVRDAAVLRIVVLQDGTTEANNLRGIHVHIRDKQIISSNEFLEWNGLPRDHKLDVLKLVEKSFEEICARLVDVRPQNG